MITIFKILSGVQENFKSFPDDLKLNALVYFKNASIITVDMER